MAKLIYITNMSLDGYIEDASGSFDWLNAYEVHGFIRELIRPIGTHLYGRRLYETMAYWEAPVESYSPEQREFAKVWQKAEKVVFSRSFSGVAPGNVRVERNFDPEAIRQLKKDSPHDIMIGGAELASAALDAGLVDECDLFVYPVIAGGGKPAFRPAALRHLELVETHRFTAGVMRLKYRVKSKDQ